MSVNWDLLRDNIADIVEISKFNSSKTELIIKCPYCQIPDGDSRNIGKLYISTNEDYLVFNCFRCSKYGSLVRLLKDLDLEPKEYISQDLINRKWTKTENVIGSKGNINKRFKEKTYNTKGQNFDRYIYKKQYIKGRLGFDVNISSIPGIIFDVRNFVISNKIFLTDSQNKIIPFLEDNFVGFVCNLGKLIVFSNIDKTSDFRFYKLELISDEDNPYKDFYGIKVGPILDKVNKIILCEGVFDLLVPYYLNLLPDIIKDSCLIASVIGKGYYNSVISVLDYCCLSMANFVILSDSDVDEYKYTNVRKHPQVNNLEIYKNKVGKDFGKEPIIPMKNIFSSIDFFKERFRK